MTPGETGLSRVVRVLEAFEGRTVMTRGELVRRTGLPQASGYRLIREMVACGFLDATASGVQTGLRLWELATRESRFVRLKDTASPFMEDLQGIIQQHTQLWVLDGSEVICVERLSAPGAVANLARIAGRLPANLITPGIVLAAFGDRQAQDAFVSSPPPAFTPSTPTRELELRRVLAETRRLGYARADGWIAPDISGWGFPVRNSTAEVVAALSVVLPNEADVVAAAVPAARLAALSISRALGWRGGLSDRTGRAETTRDTRGVVLDR